MKPRKYTCENSKCKNKFIQNNWRQRHCSFGCRLDSGTVHGETENDCHLFKLTNKSGYAVLSNEGKTVLVSRYLYEKYIDKVPNDMTVTRTCGILNCVNVKHFVLTENKKRSKR